MEIFRYMKKKIGIPKEYLDYPVIEYMDNKITIYNYQSLRDFNNDEVFLTHYNIVGESLVIDVLTKYHIVIKGKIRNIEFNNVQN